MLCNMSDICLLQFTRDYYDWPWTKTLAVAIYPGWAAMIKHVRYYLTLDCENWPQTVKTDYGLWQLTLDCVYQKTRRHNTLHCAEESFDVRWSVLRMEETKGDYGVCHSLCLQSNKVRTKSGAEPTAFLLHVTSGRKLRKQHFHWNISGSYNGNYNHNFCLMCSVDTKAHPTSK